jgi:Flp pilus assembly protein TadD
VGILDHTPPEELAVYNSRKARRTRARAFQVYYKEREEEARAEGQDKPPKDEIRADFDKKYLPGYFGHRMAFGIKGRYGKWIRGHNAAVLINDIVFSHGDWSEEISRLGIEEVNQRVRDELSGELPLQDGIAFHLKGPLQYRGLAEVQLTRDQQEGFDDRVNRILANLGAKRMVVGHTVTRGTIEPRFGGKHISVDVGMNELYNGGHQVALVIEADALYAAHFGGKVELPAFLDQQNYFDYLEKVAAVDPENINVQQSLAEEYAARGDLEKARLAAERLFRIDKAMPFRYRRILGDLYRMLGDEPKALEQYSLYFDELQAVVEDNPDNPYLRNTLARFCLERDLFLDRAETSIQKALEMDPESSAFLTTLARLQFARKDFDQAVRTLEKVERETSSYEVLYYLGLSYIGLNESDKARDAFELALKRYPERAEARDELRKLNDSSQMNH